MDALSEAIEALADKRISFGMNATMGPGGQGEFLRQMVRALDRVQGSRVISRRARAEHGECVDVPFSGVRRSLFDLTLATPLFRSRKDWLTLLGDLDFDARLAEQVGEPDLFDGIVAQCRDTLKALRRTNARLVLTSLNTHVDNLVATLEEEHRRLGLGERHFVHPRMRQRTLEEIELSDRIRVNSDWAKTTFVARGVPPEKIHVIHPSVDLNHFRPVEKKDDVFRVLAVSTIDPRKGIVYLLQAFEQARLPRSELVLIGGTGDRWSRRILRDFLGRNPNIRQVRMDVTTAPVAESYGSASVVVHPALEDGYALAVPQAMASGRPVIVTRQTGASELIRDGENGFVVERRSIEGIKDGLQLLAGDRDLRERMGRAARETVAHLDDAAFASELLGFYRQVLA